MDQKNPQRFDVDAKRTPNLVRLVVEANRQLQLQTMGFTYATSPAVVLPSVGAPTPPGTSQPSARWVH